MPNIALAKAAVDISNNGANSKTKVDVRTNTDKSTICQNGKCVTTDAGNGKSIVCINEKCYSSESGNLKIKLENKNTTINIDTNTSNKPASRPAEIKKNEMKKKIVETRSEIKKILDELKNFFKSLRF